MSFGTTPGASFADALDKAKRQGRPLLLDGAVGTELDNRGADTSTPVWSGLAPLENPELLRKIHEDYVAAGAEVITASTFRTTKRAFEKARLPKHRWEEAVEKAVSIARKAAGVDVLVAGSVAPLEDCFDPGSAPRGPHAHGEHRLLMETLAAEKVDLFWLETFGTLGELDAACRAAQDIGQYEHIPFAVSVTTNRQGQLISGEPLKEAIALATSLGASAFSINCVPVSHIQTALPILKENSRLPIGAYANLGVADENQDWNGSAHLSSEAYAKIALAWKTDLIGGCCGTTPAHIRAITRRIE
jgi:S-methylmethionine-dependent homocysteine/selenocysteine methylase